jgi:hypothetical protein
LSYTPQKEKTVLIAADFAKICYHASFLDVKFNGVSVDLSSHVTASTVLFVDNKTYEDGGRLQWHNGRTKFRETRLTITKAETRGHTDIWTDRHTQSMVVS